MVAGRPSDPGPTPPSLTPKQWSLLPPVVIDSVPSGARQACSPASSQLASFPVLCWGMHDACLHEAVKLALHCTRCSGNIVVLICLLHAICCLLHVWQHSSLLPAAVWATMLLLGRCQ